MGLEPRTVKILVIVLVVILVIGAIVGLLLGLLLPIRYVELEVWPRSENSYRWDEPLIQFKVGDAGSYQPWIWSINDFLRQYETSVPEEPPRAPCTTHHRQEPHLRSPNCDQAMRLWAPCTADDLYGYAVGKPCIFLRLSHIHYWMPEPYNVSSHLPLPVDMPDHLRRVMHQRPAHQYGDYIWVSCDGEYNSDKENIGPIQYIPEMLPPGFPTNRLHTADRYPRGARGYVDPDPGPLVAVFFEYPRRGVLINVECRVWSRDLAYYSHSYYRYGRARFELFVE